MKPYYIERMGPYFAAGATAVALLLLALAGIYSFRQAEHVDSELCRNAVENREAVRKTWNAARLIVLETASDPHQVNDFFDAILRPIPALECIDNQPVPKEE